MLSIDDTLFYSNNNLCYWYRIVQKCNGVKSQNKTSVMQCKKETISQKNIFNSKKIKN